MLRRGALLSRPLRPALARPHVVSKLSSSSSASSTSASNAASRLPDDKKSLRDFIRVPSAAQTSAGSTGSQCATSFPEAARIGSEESEEEPPLPSSIDQLLAERGVTVTSWADWQMLDTAEQARGAASGRPRLKITNVQEMLAIIAAGPA